MEAYRRVYDSRHRRLTTKNRDQLRNPTLGNPVWATFLTLWAECLVFSGTSPNSTVLHRFSHVCRSLTPQLMLLMIADATVSHCHYI